MLGALLSRTEVKHFVLFSLISAVRGDCGPPPKLNNAVPQGNINATSFPTNTVVIYKCLKGYYNIHAELDVTTCRSNSQWTHIKHFCEGSCRAPPGSRYAQPSPEEKFRSYYTHGITVTYVCRQGYDSIPGMNPVITCLQNSTWSELSVFCQKKSCGDPGKPQNGTAIILTDLLYRAKVKFICDEGYSLIGSPFTQCLVKDDTVKWNKDLPNCQPITCSSPPSISGGTHDGGANIENFAYNSTVYYKCDDDFLLIGEASIHCTTKDKVKGIWSSPPPKCEAIKMFTLPMPSGQDAEKHISSGDCGPPKAVSNAQLRPGSPQSYPVGTRLTYVCIPGYEYVSGQPIAIVCLDSSEWSEVSGSCQGRRCPYPNIENGRIVEDSDLRLGAQITFACDEGYRPVGRNGARCIFRNSQMMWDNAPPHCERIPCLPPPAIAHGDHDGNDEYTHGSVVTYRCENQYSLIGSKSIVCTSDENNIGMWSAPAPECKVVRCRTPEVLNGVMKTSYQPSYTYQDRVLFECKSGFKLKNNRGDTSCGADSTWQPALPECIPGPTIQSPVGSTVKPVEETTKTEMEDHTEEPESPPDKPGSNISVPVAIGKISLVLPLMSLTLQSHIMVIFH